LVGTAANGAKPAGQTNGSSAKNAATAPAMAGARNRAAEDPIVRYMQEKFKGEIRTVIDKRDGKKNS